SEKLATSQSSVPEILAELATSHNLVVIRKFQKSWQRRKVAFQKF
ncbi:unnamed protein product, partial [Callosobruchus maculatus]